MINTFLTVFLDPVNLVFTFIMVFLFSFDLIKGKNRDSSISSIIGALGMLGTFVGIFLGLINFDQNNIESSVPSLLSGMKLAFITSIIGLILSNILKFIKSRGYTEETIKDSHSENTPAESSDKLLLKYMKDIKDSIIQSNENFSNNISIITSEQKQLNNNLIHALVGNNEHSLSNNMKLLRKEMSDHQVALQEKFSSSFENITKTFNGLINTNNSFLHEITNGNTALINEFRSFAKQMASNNMDAFTQAIQSCVKDLNNQLQDQFGDNFKHLNIAVTKLLQWQENYKATIEYTTTLQKNIFSSMAQIDASLKSITNSAQNFTKISENLEDRIVALDNQENAIMKSLNSLNKISNDAIDFIPKINSYIEKVNLSLSSVCNNFLKVSQLGDNNIKTQYNNILISLESISKEINIVSQNNISSIKNQINAISEAASNLEKSGLQITQRVNDNINKMVEENNDNIQNNLRELNVQLAHTLNTSLESLGNQLATVSEKFVKDYMPLTEQLKRLVELSKR
ncbi:MotA/TolQ/ExbB proton channel family protein [Fusobacterium sp. PH5-44]|uniref:MotA/TolQ/ExbB proton channel family protein n=1 Tax=unclassified Fusobacterium TaxID=2648384 RepID=UPI003D25D6FB